jgi:hypothetical protein
LHKVLSVGARFVLLLPANIKPGSQSNGHPDILLSHTGQEIRFPAPVPQSRDPPGIPARGKGSPERKNTGLDSIFATHSRNGQLWISKSRIFVQYLTEIIVFPVYERSI